MHVLLDEHLVLDPWLPSGYTATVRCCHGGVSKQLAVRKLVWKGSGNTNGFPWQQRAELSIQRAALSLGALARVLSLIYT